ncbi:MAG: hypothetical protein JNM50_00775 [Chromatiales bacterium]|jgi:hypothetical protein|nr:hypothetical protein [Chromatiales bacterium]
MSLWAITSYFNPLGYERRLINYRTFRAHLGVPLLTVEWSPDSRFELGPGDADQLVQLGGGSLLWQKERLLNVAVGLLPPECRFVAWLDCDIVFQRADWGPATVAALEDDAVVQLYDRVVYLDRHEFDGTQARRDWSACPRLFERPGVVSAIARRDPLPDWIGAPGLADTTALEGSPSAGFAWAASREFLSRHPLFDSWVVGGGDSAACYAALGVPERVVRVQNLSERHQAHYLPRARAIAREVAGRVRHVPGTLFALWHGEMVDRRYRSRHEIVARHGFDPETFLQRAPSGVWQWTDRAAGLSPEVRAYFAGRNEDGAGRTPAALRPVST